MSRRYDLRPDNLIHHMPPIFDDRRAYRKACELGSKALLLAIRRAVQNGAAEVRK